MQPGAVLAPALWGTRGGAGVSKGGQSLENFVSYMYKYAVFDTNPTYYRYIFIPDIQLHSPKNYFGVAVGAKHLTGGHGIPLT